MPPTLIELTEYQPRQLPPTALTPAEGQILWRDYGRYVTVEFPSPKTDNQWQLTALGWVGYLPLSPRVQLTLQPKTPLSNLFRMLETAYDLDPHWLDGLVGCQSLPDFFERLALVLAQRVLERVRRGIYQTYLPRSEALPYLRGRLDMTQALCSRGQMRQVCHYQEQTADVMDNRILAWTLHLIARSGLCSERTLPTVRRAFRALPGEVSLQPVSAQQCLSRFYHRLNDDYHPLHALCRFFLEQAGPAHPSGDYPMLPFLIDMAALYERFVARWLETFLRARTDLNLRLKNQEQVWHDPLHSTIDLVLYEADSGRPRCVLDTKYKVVSRPAPDDLHQVVAYAELKGCSEAILIYPQVPGLPLDTQWGKIRLRSLTFGLEGDLTAAGQMLLRELVKNGRLL